MKLKEEREKVGLKLNLQKTKIMAPSGGCCGSQEEQLHSQGVVAAQSQEGLQEPSHAEGQEGRQEEIPLIQGKKQRLCFAGAVVKRYPTPKIRETQVRWEVLQEAIRG